MFDPKSLQTELHQARQARIDAEAAGCEVEALIAAVQRFQPGKQRLLFMVAGVEAESFDAANQERLFRSGEVSPWRDPPL